MPNPRMLKTAVRLMKKGFGIKNRLLSPYTTNRGDITLYVLKKNNSVSATKPFTLLATIRDFGQDVEGNAFRNRIYFEIAESEPIFGTSANKHFGEIIGVATHVAIVPHGQIFAVNIGDEFPVIQTDFTFRLYANITGQKFTLSTDV